MRKSTAAVALAGSLGLGAFAGSALLGSAGAQTTTTPSGSIADPGPGAVDGRHGPGVLSDVLDELVANDTITATQRQAILDGVRAKIQQNGGHFDGLGGHGPHGAHRVVERVAEIIGVDAQVVHDGLANGDSIADIAAAHGSSGQAVIDALVADAKARLDQAVADGKLTQSDADTRLSEATDRITRLVSGAIDLPAGRDGGFGHHGWHDDDNQGPPPGA